MNIAVVDDARDQLVLMEIILGEGVPDARIDTFEDPLKFLSSFKKKKQKYDLLITDYRMPGMNGMELMQQVLSLDRSVKVVIMTAYGRIEEAVDMMRSGAYDFLLKPIEDQVLFQMISRLKEEQGGTRKESSGKNFEKNFSHIVSGSPAMKQVLELATRYAHSESSVLILGESGTGKELLARMIHKMSLRSEKPFITVNLAALPEDLIESELFGHAKGAFTGAVEKRSGRFEEANTGTLFIDEVGDIPMSIQIKLLRGVQFGTYERVGESKERRADIRFVAATNRNLAEMIQNRDFRLDLYYRLNVLPLIIPPLRERKEDIPAMVERFLAYYGKRNGKLVQRITDPALETLLDYPFPGNVRELENIVERAVILCRGDTVTRHEIMLDDVMAKIKTAEESSSETTDIPKTNLSLGYETLMNHFEAELLKQALKDAEGNRSEAARRLGISERKMRYREDRLNTTT